MFVSKCALVFAMPLLASAAMAEEARPRDLSVEQAPVAQVASPRPGSLSTSIVADRADATYAVGETVRLTLTANQESYVTVVDVGPTGAVTQLFPNRFQPDNHLRGNEPVEIAGPSTGAHVTVGQPTGTELIKVITSSKPIVFIPDSQLQGAGPFRTVAGGVKTLMRDLNVVTEAPASNDTLIDMANYGLYTTPERRVASPGAAVPVISGQAPAATAAHVEIPVDQPFPLLVASDKAKYRIGEKATIAVTTTQACNLTVLEFNASGVARTLFPTVAAPNPALVAQQTVFVAGASGAELPIAGPAGTEQVLAICTASEGTGPAGTPLPTATPNAATDAAVVSRNLSLAANHPGTAMASVTFDVHP